MYIRSAGGLVRGLARPTLSLVKLASVRDKRLYKAEWPTFEAYCRDRWGFSDEYARLNMRASEVMRNLQSPTIVGLLPTTNRKRALSPPSNPNSKPQPGSAPSIPRPKAHVGWRSEALCRI